MQKVPRGGGRPGRRIDLWDNYHTGGRSRVLMRGEQEARRVGIDRISFPDEEARI
jgi:hypothetical protein